MNTPLQYAYEVYAEASSAIRRGTPTSRHFDDLMAIICDPNLKPRIKLAAANAHCAGSALRVIPARHG